MEIALAQKTPVMQAEHVIDDRTALNFYDCLVPKIKEHRRFKLQRDAKFSLADFKSQYKVRQLDIELEKLRQPKLEEKCRLQAEMIKEYESEVAIVKWYMEVMEHGVDTKDVCEKYTKLRKQFKLLKKESDNTIRKLTNRNIKLERRYEEAMERLEKQQEKIVKPLIEECSMREKEIHRLKREIVERTRNLKILFAITKSPKMCNIIYKAERRRVTAEQMKAIDDRAILTLRQYRFDQSNVCNFVDKVFEQVYDQVYDDTIAISPASHQDEDAKPPQTLMSMIDPENFPLQQNNKNEN